MACNVTGPDPFHRYAMGIPKGCRLCASEAKVRLVGLGYGPCYGSGTQNFLKSLSKFIITMYFPYVLQQTTPVRFLDNV
jgi:hypothetical protein